MARDPDLVSRLFNMHVFATAGLVPVEPGLMGRE
jgi:hypothetical protein